MSKSGKASIAVYGLKGCDTCRKARKWLSEKEMTFSFFDVREEPVSKTMVQRWTRQIGWEKLLNRRSTTWRGLDASLRESLDETAAVALMVRYPALIRRPVLEVGDVLMTGFDARVQDILDASGG